MRRVLEWLWNAVFWVLVAIVGVLIVALAWAPKVQAQTVYREGNVYTDKPGGVPVYLVDNVVQAERIPVAAPVQAQWVPPERSRIPQRHFTPVQVNITVSQEPSYVSPLNSPVTGFGRWPCTRPGCYDARPARR